MDSASSWLLEPISEEFPCGENLEDTQLLASFDAYRVFGQMTPPSGDVEWREMRNAAEEALQKSKDFRLLANYAVARLHTEGLVPFCNMLAVASQWLESYPDNVYPLIDDDAILRRNALNNFSDRMAVVDALRRAHFVRHQAVGAFSLRDYEIAKGYLQLAEGEGESASEAQINGALSAVDTEELQASADAFAEAMRALENIDSLMRDRGGSEAAPDIEPLVTPFKRLHAVLAEQLAQRAESAAAGSAEGAEPGSATGGQGVAVGSIRSRDDAIRALDAIATYFRKNEPSSPVPLFIERAKRLVDKDFLELLADIAPDALGQAKQAGGIRDEE
jgi:type VI secretion system protein ImpA